MHFFNLDNIGSFTFDRNQVALEARNMIKQQTTILASAFSPLHTLHFSNSFLSITSTSSHTLAIWRCH